MIPELGLLALIMAMIVAAWQVVLPWLNIPAPQPLSLRDRAPTMPKTLAYLQLTGVTIAFVILAYCFVTNDFSVAYVANNSDVSLPLGYKISAVWGAHEGSLLLWMLLLSIWMVVAVRRAAKLPQQFRLYLQAVLGALSLGFLGFIIFTSNPFLRLLPYPPQHGGDLNPLLQDMGLIMHPPILYSGYVGFAIPFAFALAALITGKLDRDLIRWLRPLALAAWAMLTLGITLGSWWAYYELGWGGWWFWDPVENASLMPWLVGTALIHSLIASEKQGLFKKWTLLLAIFVFALSLFGTFLVRSGVLTSVHAFASDPTRGTYILLYLAACVGGALTIFALRAQVFQDEVGLTIFSRPGLMLLNNILLASMAATVLLGTVYPLILDALGLGKISVGPPYFNQVILPMAVGLLLLMGLLPEVNWRGLFLGSGRSFFSFPRRWEAMLIIGGRAVLALGAAIGLLAIFAQQVTGQVLLGVVVALWLALATLKLAYQGLLKSGLKLSWLGMVLAHLGMAVLATGITLTSHYSVDQDLRFSLHETKTIAGYDFTFSELADLQGANYQGVQATFTVSRDGEQLATLKPEKRVYAVQKMPLSETAIAAGLWRDLYVALGEPITGDAWAVRVYYKPFVRWLWLGGLMMFAGGLVAAVRVRRVV